jgi:hypothetical protein
MTLVDEMVSIACSVATAGQSFIAERAGQSRSCVAWFRREIVQALSELPDVTVVEGREYIDLTVTRGAEQVLCQVKAFPTNYKSFGQPITEFIQSVVYDLGGLALHTDESVSGLSIWMAYYIPEPPPPQWARHVEKVEAAAARLIKLHRLRLEGNDFAYLYIMQSR